MCKALLAACLTCGLAVTPLWAAPAQQPPAPPRYSVDEATLLTNGWALLAQGLLQEASGKAAAALATYPRSIAALALSVEVEVARGGSNAGLDVYERWMGARTLEEPGVLRRVALAVLRDAAAGKGDASVRIGALKALTADGDSAAAAALTDEAVGDTARLGAAAALGSREAVDQLVRNLQNPASDKADTIDALADSGSRRAAPAIAARLTDSDQRVQAAAMRALGKIGTDAQIPAIRPFLQDQSAFLRATAAAALYQLGDDSGLALLQSFARSDVPVTRLSAAEAMSARPNQEWLELVRSLLSADQPEVRVAAARLIAPHDPGAAQSTLVSLQQDPNIAIRELASRTLGQTPGIADLTTLRRLLHNSDALTRVHAADRILNLTR